MNGTEIVAVTALVIAVLVLLIVTGVV